MLLLTGGRATMMNSHFIFHPQNPPAEMWIMKIIIIIISWTDCNISSSSLLIPLLDKQDQEQHQPHHSIEEAPLSKSEFGIRGNCLIGN